SVCGKREATVYRSSSGEYICNKCLDRVIMKNVKKTLAKTKKLTSNMNILFYGTWLAPTESLIAIRIVPRVESKYKANITISIPEDMAYHLRNIVNHYWNIETYDYVIQKGLLADCILEDIDNARRIALRKGADVVITPYPRLLLIKAGLQAIMSGRSDLIKASRPIHDTDPPVISALFRLEKEFLIKYAYVRGIPLLQPKHHCSDMGAGSISINVLKDSHEVEFNSLRTLEVLAEFAEPRNNPSSIPSGEEEH
ncbi:MAG: hypothetical protein GSR79_00930, partial [Desulfurococcales archaeon]|nr:hypothetical protein [Desulfurococcales archaeon]